MTFAGGRWSEAHMWIIQRSLPRLEGWPENHQNSIGLVRLDLSQKELFFVCGYPCILWHASVEIFLESDTILLVVFSSSRTESGSYTHLLWKLLFWNTEQSFFPVNSYFNQMTCFCSHQCFPIPSSLGFLFLPERRTFFFLEEHC